MFFLICYITYFSRNTSQFWKAASRYISRLSCPHETNWERCLFYKMLHLPRLLACLVPRLQPLLWRVFFRRNTCGSDVTSIPAAIYRKLLLSEFDWRTFDRVSCITPRFRNHIYGNVIVLKKSEHFSTWRTATALAIEAHHGFSSYDHFTRWLSACLSTPKTMTP